MGSVAELRVPETDRNRAGNDAYGFIRRAILTSRYESGERLPLEAIANEAGVSITAVRNAIQQLAIEGLVEVRPRSGSYVATITPDDVEEICDIRRGLECLAAETAVLRITPEQLTRFRFLVLEMGAPVTTNEQREIHEMKNTELHRLLVRASGNKRLVETYENLKAHIQIARLHSLGRLDWKKRLPEENQEHQEILAALQLRDADRLKVVLRRHIERAKMAMLLALRGPQ